MFVKNEEETRQQPRVGTEFILGNLMLNPIARMRRVKFKLKHPRLKKRKERHHSLDVSGYARPFVLSSEQDIARTDTGMVAVIYDVLQYRTIDFTRYDLRLPLNTKVVIVGFDM